MTHRRFAHIPCDLDHDPAWRALTMDQQWLYLLLLTQPDVSNGGVLAVRETRWSHMAAKTTPELVHELVGQLHAEGWIYRDETKQELFVSGYFRAESVHKQPRYVVSATEAIAECWSRPLRAVASAELGSLLAEPYTPPPTRGLRLLILERDDYQCVRCGWKPGDPVPAKKGTNRPVYRTLELDHIWPKSRGGPDTADNFQVLCTSCNCSKGAPV
jgi:5-methylcytosine-specific restriction endonuclease McrA